VAEGRHADLELASLLQPVKAGLDHLDWHSRSSRRPLRGHDHVVAVKPEDPVRPTRDSRDLLSRKRTEKRASIRISMHACQSPARLRQSRFRIVLPCCPQHAEWCRSKVQQPDRPEVTEADQQRLLTWTSDRQRPSCD